MGDYVDKFDTVPDGQSWLWWHFKRGGCFVLAGFATMIAFAIIIWIIVTLISMFFVKKQPFSAMPDESGAIALYVMTSPVILIAAVAVIGAIYITTSSIGAEVYGRLWQPCEQAK